MVHFNIRNWEERRDIEIVKSKKKHFKGGRLTNTTKILIFEKVIFFSAPRLPSLKRKKSQIESKGGINGVVIEGEKFPRGIG